ncbi:MAG: UDP-N-acetylglucosamine 2-epimerase (non-hydrolyzing) [Desulfovibrionaceae bacterium]|jgi:UDP-N-acetylglucosamine 2-epimerase (non-hydrolysing)|nr:UDP-N-acetylglucosamine 2-epimerase (non-hydrolyzing) [Desulfovibrionaceae bacterium]
MPTIVHVMGARPNFMKVAPVHRALAALPPAGWRTPLRQVLVHTGQHYSANLSDVFIRQLGLPEPDVNLGVGSGTHAEQTGAIMVAFEKVLADVRPDLVVVVGDVNSTIACALTARKLGVPVAHVEAGLRSFDESMPEEINRVLTDAISDLLFTTEESGNENLWRTGVERHKIHFVGNTMIDSLLLQSEAAAQRDTLGALGLAAGDAARGQNGATARPFALLTLHRPSNVDRRETLAPILEGVARLSERLPVVFPLHPRTAARSREFGLEGHFEPLARVARRGAGLGACDPVDYLDMLNMMRHAALVLTDSGGVQEETTFLGTPCLTLRANTERPVTVSRGTNVLVGQDMGRMQREADKILSGRGKKGETPDLWDGKAGARIAAVLADRLG